MELWVRDVHVVHILDAYTGLFKCFMVQVATCSVPCEVLITAERKHDIKNTTAARAVDSQCL